jgi:protein PET100
MYIMFPIGWMYYFGTNLDDKFSVKDFWPTKEQLNKIPTEREDISKEVEAMKRRRLQRREARLEEEAAMGLEGGDGSAEGFGARPVRTALGVVHGGPLDRMAGNAARAVEREGQGWVDWVRGRS